MNTQVYMQSETNKNTRPDYIHPNWVNDETWDFLSSLSFQGYILAGNSVSNMYEQVPLQGDLDFWACGWTDFLNGFKEMSKFYKNFSMYPSMIEMYNDDNVLPKINLIYTKLSPFQTIDRFDFPYCKAYWSPQTGLKIKDQAIIAIQKKFIPWTNPTSPLAIKFKRILKAVGYGYRFTHDFWYQLRHLNLIANPNKITDSRSRTPCDIKLEDLDLTKFELASVPINVSDKSNKALTLKEITYQYRQIALTPNVKLPILLTFNSDELNLMTEYISLIISQNPLKDTHYLEVRIGTHFVNYSDRYEKYFENLKLLTNPTDSSVLTDDEESVEKISDSDDDSDILLKKKINQGKVLNEKVLKVESENESEDEIPVKKTPVVKKNIVKTPKTLKTKTIICENKFPRIIQLDSEGTSWITIEFVPNELSNLATSTYESMWNLHPETKHKIIMYEQEVKVFRYSQSYLNTPTNLDHVSTRSYMYSGFDTGSNNADLPEQFEPFYEYARSTDPRYNQVIANWYSDSQDYIAPHADCVRGMGLNYKIALLSLYPDSNPINYRYLQIKPKSSNVNFCVDVLNIRLDHGSIITMCGLTQENFTHGIEKTNSNVSSRISLSFRQMV